MGNIKEFFKRNKKSILTMSGAAGIFYLGYRTGKTNRPIQLNMIILQREKVIHKGQ